MVQDTRVCLRYWFFATFQNLVTDVVLTYAFTIQETSELEPIQLSENGWCLLQQDLRAISGASIGTDGGKASGVVAEGGGPFLIQKFVKSKGPHAFIVRQVWCTTKTIER